MNLSDDEVLLVETVKRLVNDEVASAARSWEANGLPQDIFKSIGELGLLAIITPEDRGGAGLSHRDLGLVVMELARGDVALAHALANHNQALALLARCGHPELDDFIAGVKKLSWRFAGAVDKPFACDAVVSVHADTLEYHVSMVDLEAHKELGARALGYGQTKSEDPTVYNHAIDHEALNAETTLLVSCIACGLGHAALAVAADYALERKQFGKPIANFQAIQWKLADGHMLLEAASLLTEQALNETKEPQTSMALKASIDAVTKLVDDGLQTHGGYGYTEEYAIEKYYRDAQFLASLRGTRRAQALKIADSILEFARHQQGA